MRIHLHSHHDIILEQDHFISNRQHLLPPKGCPAFIRFARYSFTSVTPQLSAERLFLKSAVLDRIKSLYALVLKTERKSLPDLENP